MGRNPQCKRRRSKATKKIVDSSKGCVAARKVDGFPVSSERLGDEGILQALSKIQPEQRHVQLQPHSRGCAPGATKGRSK